MWHARTLLENKGLMITSLISFHNEGSRTPQRILQILEAANLIPEETVTPQIPGDPNLREALNMESCGAGLGCSSSSPASCIIGPSRVYFIRSVQASYGIYEELKIAIYNVDPESSGVRPWQTQCRTLYLSKKNVLLGLCTKHGDHEMDSVLPSDHTERKTQMHLL